MAQIQIARGARTTTAAEKALITAARRMNEPTPTPRPIQNFEASTLKVYSQVQKLRNTASSTAVVFDLPGPGPGPHPSGVTGAPQLMHMRATGDTGLPHDRQ